MSALPLKADMLKVGINVRLVPTADMKDPHRLCVRRRELRDART